MGHRITGDRSKRGRKAGWEFLHVCVDGHSRLAYSEMLPDEKAASASCFLIRAVGQTSIKEWAYKRAYESSAEREEYLQPWIEQYNYRRPHSALNRKPPITRLENWEQRP